MLRVLLPVLAVAGAWKLGLANVMLHATGNESCAVLAEAGYHNVTCVWSHRSVLLWDGRERSVLLWGGRERSALCGGHLCLPACRTQASL